MTIAELYAFYGSPFCKSKYFYKHEGKLRRVYGIRPVHDWCFEVILAGLKQPILVNDDEKVEKG